MPGDDELTFDFGKVADWFKRKKKAEPQPAHQPSEQPPMADKHAAVPHEPHHPHPPASVEKDDEITIDFSRIKGWFSRKEHAGHEGGAKDELGIDFSKAWNWVKAHPVLVVLALLLILQFVPNKALIAGRDYYLPWGGMFMRLQSQDLPAAEGWAQNHVTTILRGQIANAINQQYPNLPDERKNKLIEEEWQKNYQAQRAQIEQQVQLVAQQIKAFWQYESNGRTYTYMPDIDPYFYLRYARNLVEKGRLGDEVRDGKQWDNHVNAPLGGEIVPELQPYALAWQYRLMRIVNPGINLMQAATYFPIIFILLAMIPAFLIGRRFAGMAGGIVSATMIGIMPAIMARTTWGHADTDPWNIFFPLLLTWLYILMMDAEDAKRIVGFGALAGLVTGIYAFAWRGGWWYVFDFLLASFVILVLSELARVWKHRDKLFAVVRRRALAIGVYLVSSALFVSWFMTFHDFAIAVLQPLRFTVIKAAAHPSLWPNVYTTVAELNPTNIAGAVGAVGGWMYFWIALVGIAMLLFQRSDSGWKVDLTYAPLFAMWFIATMYASTKGVRFTLLLAPAFAVAFGIALGRIYSWVVRVSARDLKLPAKLAHAVMIVLIAMILASQARASYGTARGDIPIMNDAWWNALTAIKQDSKPDAIINSWWDFGHHFKYVADRAVTFDGASQNTPMAHWIGRVLVTSNESEAVGILRMLDCGSNSAFEVLNAQFQDPVRSVRILYRLFGVDRKAALAILAREGVDEQEKVLKFTHCDPPENYFIASDDMIGKSGVWSHFGLWNFERAKLWIVLRNQDQETAVQAMMREWNYTKEQAEQAYYDVQSIADEGAANAWISPWPGILGGAADCSVQEKSVVVCGNGLQHNLGDGQTVVRVQGGAARPPMLVRLGKDGKYTELRFNDSNVGVGALLYQTGPESWRSVIASPELLQSTFMKLYFLEGHGLKHFKEFNRQRHITGGEVITYKIDWKGAEPNEFSGLRAAREAAAPVSESPRAKEGDTVSVHYIGALLNGSVFDSSIRDWKKLGITVESAFADYELGQPLTFTIGSGQVIEGFDAAVRGMSIGDEQIVQIPPNAAYGFDPKKHFLGNQTLRFKIRLVAIQPKNQ